MKNAEQLMLEFSKNTGLSSDKPPRRYLWTDAFAVCNFIQLFKNTEDETYKQLAIDLVDQVHSTLGKHRKDDREGRIGWLSNPEHPTKKGLRIGKSLPERKKGEPINQTLEWERDGQYFHYLTKWMIALAHMGEFLNEDKYQLWAVDLLEASLSFIHGDRMYWKMSIDLSRPLISSMGQHDPLDGYVTYKLVNRHTEKDLVEHIKRMSTLMQSIRLPTTDPLGIGGLLVDAYYLHQMKEDTDLVSQIIKAADYGLQLFNPLNHTLAFRELGLAIGLEAAKKMVKLPAYWPIETGIIDFWLNHQDWKEHVEINQVMLATSLIPDEFLKV